MKTRLALFAVVVLAGVGLARADEKGRPYPTPSAEQPKGAPKSVVEKPDPAQPTPQPAESLTERPKGGGQPAIAPEALQKGASEKGTVPDGSRTDSKTDRERMVGNWFIVNDDSLRQGEMWIITEDSILMHAREDKFGPDTVHYAHRLDASKNPKQIDITVSRVKGPTVGVIKGIYILDADELRLCLGKMGKDRPAEFPEKQKPGEVLVLRREGSGAASLVAKGAGSPTVKGAGEPAANEKPPVETDRERMVGNWFIVNDDSRRQGEMWVITEDSILMHAKDGGANAVQYAHRLDAGKDPKQIDITVSRIKGPAVGVIKGIYILDAGELRLCLGELGEDRPAEFPEKPKPGEVLVLHRASSGAAPPAATDAVPPAVKGGGSPTAKGAPSPAAAKGKSPAKTDQDLMVGNWVITNDDSLRKGEAWVITDDSILMHAMEGGANAVHYAHRLDASKNPKQIDITISRIKGPAVGVIKGIYVLERDELRLCLGEVGKDRPAAFPEKPKPGEVLVLRRASSGAARPAAKDAPSPTVKGAGSPTVKGGGSPTLKGAGSPAAKGAPSPAVDDAGSPAATDAGAPAATDAVPRGAQDGEPTRKVFTPEEAIKQRSKEPVTVRFKVAAVQDTSRSPGTGFGVGSILLKDGGSFSVRIVPPAMDTIMRLDIEPAKHFTGKFVWVTGLVQPDSNGSSFHITVDDLDRSQFAVLKE